MRVLAMQSKPCKTRIAETEREREIGIFRTSLEIRSIDNLSNCRLLDKAMLEIQRRYMEMEVFFYH